MLRNLSRTILLAAALSAGTLAFSAAPAAAQSFGITISGGGVEFVEQRGRGRGRDRHFDRRADVCAPQQALRKAGRLGVRGADLVRVNRRAVVVDGYQRGQPVRVRFAQERGCPVLAFR